jgi:hypothetical protein
MYLKRSRSNKRYAVAGSCVNKLPIFLGRRSEDGAIASERRALSRVVSDKKPLKTFLVKEPLVVHSLFAVFLKKTQHRTQRP